MTKIELTRRLLLEQAVAAAGTLTVFGTHTNSAGAQVTAQVTAQVQVKSSPQAAGYQDRPNGGQRCSNCAHFQPPAACKIVAGRVSPQGWCKIYFAKSGN
jgi:hypothetical protein